MSTRSRIAVEQETGGYSSVYCHSDGYLEHAGYVLARHYQDRGRALELIMRGDLSRLAEAIGTKHPLFGGPRNECAFYGRDGGERDTAPRYDATLEGLTERACECDAEYLYVFGKDGVWRYRKLAHGHPVLVPVAPVAQLAPVQG